MPQSKRKPCPVCGQKMHASQAMRGRKQPWSIWCGGDCGLIFYGEYGESLAKLTARWNRPPRDVRDNP